MSVTAPATPTFSNVDSTGLVTMPPEKKGNLLGNAMVWTGQKGQDLSAMAGSIPFGIGGVVETLGLVGSTVSVAGGHVVNGESKKAANSMVAGTVMTGVGVTKVFTHGVGGVVDIGYGFTHDETLTRRIGESTANWILPVDVAGNGGMPDKGPVGTPTPGKGSVPVKGGNSYNA